LDSIVHSSFPLDLVKDFLHCADRRRQGLPYLAGQSHARANVGRLARDDEAAARAAAHRGEHREDLVGCQAVRVHDPVWGWHVVGLDLGPARLNIPRPGIQNDFGLLASES
jgi:hypothetical protein